MHNNNFKMISYSRHLWWFYESSCVLIHTDQWIDNGVRMYPEIWFWYCLPRHVVFVHDRSSQIGMTHGFMKISFKIVTSHWQFTRETVQLAATSTHSVPRTKAWPGMENTSLEESASDWIGWRENLRETMFFFSQKICGFPANLPLNQSIEETARELIVFHNLILKPQVWQTWLIDLRYLRYPAKQTRENLT